MAVFRVEKNSGYTVMSNHHLRNRALSLKAKGLLSQILSLPEDWDYTLQGLARINRESIDAIRQAIRELEQTGYIQRSRERDEKGRLRGADYVIFELPQPVPASVSPTLENPTLENPTHAVQPPCDLIDVDTNLLQFGGLRPDVGGVDVDNITIYRHLSQIGGHIPGWYQFHFFSNQPPFFFRHIKFDLHGSFSAFHSFYSPFRFEGLGHFPTSCFAEQNTEVGTHFLCLLL